MKDLETRLSNLEKEIEAIRERNSRVESDKAWETSIFRTALVATVTYIAAAVFLYLIGVQNFLLSALVPAIGFFLSTQSLPFVKKWWLKKNAR